MNTNKPIPKLHWLASGVNSEKPVRGWLHAVRTELGKSQKSVARELSIVRQSYADLESAEQRGAISLASLERAAQAMGCDLVYALVPQDKRDPHTQDRAPSREHGTKPLKVHEPKLDPIKPSAPIAPPAAQPEGELPTFLK